MAYGMITSGILGAVAGLGEAAIKKVGDINEAELKAKIDAEKEKRIEEAQIRQEGRAKDLADMNYARLRADTLADKETEQQNKYEFEKWKMKNAVEQQRLLNELPPTESENLKNEQMRSAIDVSKSTIQSNEISRQLEQKKLDTQNQISDLQNKIRSTADENESNKLRSELLLLQGKIDKPTIEKMSVDTGKVNPDTNQPIKEDVMVKVDPISGKWETIDVAARLKENRPFTKEEATSIAKAEADADPKIGARTSNWFSQDNATQYDNYVNKRVIELTNMPKGMLNSKTSDKTSSTNTDKAIEQTVKTATANPLIKFTDDPVKQGQYDTINGVLLYSESGTQGADVGRPKPTKDNPHPTAEGSYQITNIAMKDLGIKPDLPNGEYSVASKEKAAPQYYKKAYSDTQGDASAYLAYRFAPSDITNAVEKAKEKGGYWWQYAQSDYTKENMPTVVRDAKRTMLQLSRENKPVPTEIQRLILAYK